MVYFLQFRDLIAKYEYIFTNNEGLDFVVDSINKTFYEDIQMTGQSDHDIRHETYHFRTYLYFYKPLSHDLFNMVSKNGVLGFRTNEQNV